jgi:hypothetical protein
MTRTLDVLREMTMEAKTHSIVAVAPFEGDKGQQHGQLNQRPRNGIHERGIGAKS